MAVFALHSFSTNGQRVTRPVDTAMCLPHEHVDLLHERVDPYLMDGKDRRMTLEYFLMQFEIQNINFYTHQMVILDHIEVNDIIYVTFVEVDRYL
ncbi:hypothetical protein J1N35_018576, partial [Gossypium stocksii]